MFMLNQEYRVSAKRRLPEKASDFGRYYTLLFLFVLYTFNIAAVRLFF
jgi:hypothetical protein